MIEVQDADLVLRAQAGDRDAFTALYDRYFTRMYDFSYQLVRNHDDAADVVSEVFLKAMERIGSLKDAAAVRGWLYAIARNAALTTIDKRKRTAAIPEGFERPAGSGPMEHAPPDPSEQAESGELRQLVWEAAATLNPRDYSIFEMTVRQGLDSAEVAQALGVKPSHAYVLVSRMKDTVSDALSAVVLARAGRRDCADLDRIVASFRDERSPELRRAVNGHLRACEACRSSKKKYAAVAALLQGVAHASPADPGLRPRVAGELARLWPVKGPVAGGGGGGAAGRVARALVVPVAMTVLTAVSVAQGTPPQRLSGLWPVRITDVRTTPEPPAETPVAEPVPTEQTTSSPDATPRRAPGATLRTTAVPTPRPTPRPLVTFTPAPRRTPTPTLRPTATPRPTPTPTPRATPTKAPTPTPDPCEVDPRKCLVG